MPQSKPKKAASKPRNYEERPVSRSKKKYVSPTNEQGEYIHWSVIKENICPGDGVVECSKEDIFLSVGPFSGEWCSCRKHGDLLMVFQCVFLDEHGVQCKYRADHPEKSHWKLHSDAEGMPNRGMKVVK